MKTILFLSTCALLLSCSRKSETDEPAIPTPTAKPDSISGEYRCHDTLYDQYMVNGNSHLIHYDSTAITHVAYDAASKQLTLYGQTFMLTDSLTFWSYVGLGSGSSHQKTLSLKGDSIFFDEYYSYVWQSAFTYRRIRGKKAH